MIEKNDIEKYENEINDLTDQTCSNEYLKEFQTGVGSFARALVRSVASEMIVQKYKYEEEQKKYFKQTATGQDLDYKLAEDGFTRYPATYATGEVTVTGSSEAEILTGYIVKGEYCDYEIIKDYTLPYTENNITSLKVEVKALEIGTIGNCAAGEISGFASTYKGLYDATNEKEFDNAFDEETDEEFLTRTNEEISNPRMNDNKYLLEDLAYSIDEVEKANVIPLWNGKGTVKIVITEYEKIEADSDLITKVKNYVESKIITNMDLTVETIEYLDLDFRFEAQLHNDYTVELAKEEIRKFFQEYFYENIFIKDRLFYFDVAKKLEDTISVDILSNLSINNAKEDIKMEPNQMPRIKNIDIENLT